jgi:nucleoside-diphosphate-sugar epimerase
MRLLLIGGTGFIGRSVVRISLDQGQPSTTCRTAFTKSWEIGATWLRPAANFATSRPKS